MLYSHNISKNNGENITLLFIIFIWYFYRMSSCSPYWYYCWPNNNCCNPCTPVCNPCTPVCNPCPIPIVNPCPPVALIMEPGAVTAVPSGGNAIPLGTVIPPSSTAVPAGTVTVITGLTAPPITNIGGITQNNGFFTIPLSGRYIVSATATFATPASVAAGDYRQLFIYRTAAGTGAVSLLATVSSVPVTAAPTSLNAATSADLNIGDRIFFAAIQTSADLSAINVNLSSRYAITRTC